ncbi:hypothetical protein ACS0TW_30930, partial [Klebsiella michiganensis]
YPTVLSKICSTVRQLDSRRENPVLHMAYLAGFFTHDPASKQAVTRYRPDPWRSLFCLFTSRIGYPRIFKQVPHSMNHQIFDSISPSRIISNFT